MSTEEMTRVYVTPDMSWHVDAKTAQKFNLHEGELIPDEKTCIAVIRSVLVNRLEAEFEAFLARSRERRIDAILKGFSAPFEAMVDIRKTVRRLRLLWRLRKRK